MSHYCSQPSPNNLMFPFSLAAKRSLAAISKPMKQHTNKQKVLWRLDLCKSEAYSALVEALALPSNILFLLRKSSSKPPLLLTLNIICQARK